MLAIIRMKILGGFLSFTVYKCPGLIDTASKPAPSGAGFGVGSLQCGSGRVSAVCGHTGPGSKNLASGTPNGHTPASAVLKSGCSGSFPKSALTSEVPKSSSLPAVKRAAASQGCSVTRGYRNQEPPI